METTKKTPTKQPEADAKPKKAAASKPKAKPTTKAGKPVSRGTGRRKSAVARVWLRRGKGEITVNGKVASDYFDTDFNRSQLFLPQNFMKTAQYDALVNVHGGGVNAQAGAIRLGLARALLASDESVRKELRKYRLLTCDSRVKERKKYGQRGARRKFQFVKR